MSELGTKEKHCEKRKEERFVRVAGLFTNEGKRQNKDTSTPLCTKQTHPLSQKEMNRNRGQRLTGLSTYITFPSL